MRKLVKEDVIFTVELEEEDLPVRGNYMCTDDNGQDKKDENVVIDRLNCGDISAWCCLKIIAKWEDFEETTYLGGCSFEAGLNNTDLQKEAEEIASGFYDDLLEALNNKVLSYIIRGEEIASLLDDTEDDEIHYG